MSAKPSIRCCSFIFLDADLVILIELLELIFVEFLEFLFWCELCNSTMYVTDLFVFFFLIL
ncbi:hypothetical protein Scep_027042 [Stephania cephalantha]|uniref:Uncharacterized protein n=1 Tax=Stephania cephalantha TaxID=152367 RepID=A0AAP0ETH5_9MAGN